MSDRIEAALRELGDAIREELEMRPPADLPDRLLSVEAAGAALGIGRTLAFLEVRSGRLRSMKVGRRRLVASSAIADYIAAEEAGR